MDAAEKYEGWVILELMGRRRLIGYLTEQEIAGRAFLRIDILTEPPATQYYSPDAIYCITPATEETARKAAKLNHIAPVQRWEIAARPGDPDYIEAQIDEDDDPF